MENLKTFEQSREKMNEAILASDNKIIKRLFNLDTNAFNEGSIDSKTKEMIGLACSMVLRCDDCVKYHLIKWKDAGVTEDQIFEIFAIANVTAGTIVIPHLRRAVAFWKKIGKRKSITP